MTRCCFCFEWNGGLPVVPGMPERAAKTDCPHSPQPAGCKCTPWSLCLPRVRPSEPHRVAERVQVGDRDRQCALGWDLGL